MKLKEPFAVYTNFIFLLPFYFALIKNEYFWALIIIMLFIFSTIFHFSKPIGAVWWHKTERLSFFQKIFLWTDTIFALSLVSFNCYMMFNKNFSIEILIAIILAVIAFIIFIYPTKEDKYNIIHGIWHLISGVITLLLIIG